MSEEKPAQKVGLGGMVDVSGFSLEQLFNEATDPALQQWLKRLQGEEDTENVCAFNSAL